MASGIVSGHVEPGRLAIKNKVTKMDFNEDKVEKLQHGICTTA